jgi:hypothetical protein
VAGIAGYGFFAGCVLLYAVIMAWQQLHGAVTFWPVACGLVAWAVLGLLGGAQLTKRVAATEGSARAEQAFDGATAALLALAAIHLLPIAIELCFRPVFPWDAWQTWIYKAKAWFYAGGPVSLDAPATWLGDPGAASYNAPAASYPGLVSAMAYWAALCFGGWSETRVNWPVFLCALSLCLALWDQLKAQTGRPRLAALACLLFLSTPLVATHLSLAGYADIWLAGFSGLGLLALLRGLVHREPKQLFLGMVFLAAGLLVKRDAALWLACGSALWFLVRWPRGALLACAIGAVALGALLFGDFPALALPGLGVFGFQGGALMLGPLGSWPLSARNVLPDYLFHLFMADSWNLLWYFVAAVGTVLLLSKRCRPLLRPLGLFLLLLVTSQGLLFGFTVAGEWAEDGTALNRVLLHPLPAVLGVLILVLSRWLDHEPGESPISYRAIVLPVVIATLVTAVGAMIWLLLHSSGSDNQPQRYGVEQLRAVSGEARVEKGRLLITRFEDKAAVVSTGPIVLGAEDLPLLAVDRGELTATPGVFFWRPANAPGELHSRELGVGAEWLDLRKDTRWQGTIIEVGIVLYRNDRDRAELVELALHPASVPTLLSLTLSQWTQPTRWTQKSINRVQVGAANALLPLTCLVGTWLLVGLLLLAAVHGRKATGTAALVLAITGWLLLDLRWFEHSLAQARATWDHYTHSSNPDALDMGAAWDGETMSVAERVSEALGDDGPKRVLVTAPGGGTRFQLLRAKYALLPHAGYAQHEGLESLRTDAFDAILMLRSEHGGRGERSKAFIEIAGRRFDAVHSFPGGTLYLRGKLRRSGE